MGMYPLLRLTLSMFGCPAETGQHAFDGFLHHGILVFPQRQQGLNGFFRAEPRERFGGIASDQPVFIFQRLDQRS